MLASIGGQQGAARAPRLLMATVLSVLACCDFAREPRQEIASVEPGDAVESDLNPAAEDVPSAAASPLEQQSPEPIDEPPAIAAYPPVQLESIIVRRSGQRVELIARLGRVPGAGRYEVQVAKTLMFEQLVAQRSVAARMMKLGPIASGMYFVHARAVGPAGEGPFGDVRVVDTNKSGLAATTAVVAAALPDEPVTAVAPEARQRATPPDSVMLGALKARYEQLQRELAEVETVRRDTQTKLVELQARLVGKDAKGASALKAELGVLEAARLQLDREIASGLAELSRLLTP